MSDKIDATNAERAAAGREPLYHYWPGGACPVDGNQRVDMIFRDGSTESGDAGCFAWDHGLDEMLVCNGDIIAWRVTPPSEVEKLREDVLLLARTLREIRNLDPFDDARSDMIDNALAATGHPL